MNVFLRINFPKTDRSVFKATPVDRVLSPKQKLVLSRVLPVGHVIRVQVIGDLDRCVHEHLNVRS